MRKTTSKGNRKSEVDKQGRNANFNGLRFEARIINDLQKEGLVVKHFSDVEGRDYDLVGLLNAPYYIGEDKYKADLILKTKDRSIRVEFRKQVIPGTVEDKLFKVYLDSEADRENNTTVLVLDGKGVSKKTKTRLRAYEVGSLGKFKMMDSVEFKRWVKDLNTNQKNR